MSLVTVEDISVGYGADRVLAHVSLAIEPGEIVTIVGPNGSGKTTLLRSLIGAVRPEIRADYTQTRSAHRIRPAKTAHRPHLANHR